MLRLVPTDIYEELRPRAKRFDWRGVLPQHDTHALTVACRPRHNEPQWWSIWVVEAFDDRAWFRRWWEPRPTLPRFGYSLGRETCIHWLNSLPQRHGLALREAILPARSWRADELPNFEILSYAVTDADLARVWFHRRDRVDGFTGVSPLLRAGRASKPLMPVRTPERELAAKQLHDSYQPGKQLHITPEGVRYE